MIDVSIWGSCTVFVLILILAVVVSILISDNGVVVFLVFVVQLVVVGDDVVLSSLVVSPVLVVQLRVLLHLRCTTFSLFLIHHDHNNLSTIVTKLYSTCDTGGQ